MPRVRLLGFDVDTKSVKVQVEGKIFVLNFEGMRVPDMDGIIRLARKVYEESEQVEVTL